MKNKSFNPASPYVRHRDKKWIPARKRVYLYWFKFLHEAENSPDYTVDWQKYETWGGREDVMNSKFDNWWERHWERLFGTDDRGGTPFFPLTTTQPKADAYRIALLVYQYRSVGGNFEVAQKVIATERKSRRAPNTLLHPEKYRVSINVSEHKQHARKLLKATASGIFPDPR